MSRRKQSHPKPVLKRDDSLTGEDMASEIEDTMEIDKSSSCTTPATQHGSSDKESALSTPSTEQPSLATLQSVSSVSEAESTMAASAAKKRKMDQFTESAEEGESPLPPPSPAGLNVKIEPSDRDPPLSESPQLMRSKHITPTPTPTPDAEPMANETQVSAAAAASLGFPLSMNSSGLPFNTDLFTSLRYLHMLRNGLASGIPTCLPDMPELPLKSATSPSLPVPPAHLCVPCGIRFSSLSTLEAHQTYYCSHRIRQAFGTANATTGNGPLEGESQSTQDQESQPESKTPGSESASEENRNLSSMLFEAMVGPPPFARVRRSGKYYTCPYCSFSADKRVSLNRHLRSHVGLPMLATTAVSPPPPPPPLPPAPAAPSRNSSAQQHEEDEELGASVVSSRADRYCVECDIQFNSIKTFRVHKQLYCRGKVGTLRSHLLHPSQSSMPSTSNPSPSTSSLSSALITATHPRLLESNDADLDRQVSTPSGNHAPNNPNKESSASWPMLILPTQPPILVPFHIVQSANFWPDHLVSPPQSLHVMPDGVVQGISSLVNHPANTPANKPHPAQNHSTAPEEGSKDRSGLGKALRSPPTSVSKNTNSTPSPTHSPESRSEDTSAPPPPTRLVTNLDGALDLSVKPSSVASEGNSNTGTRSLSTPKSPTPEIDVAIAAKCEVIIKTETASPQPPSVANSPVTKSPTLMEFSSSNDPLPSKGWRESHEPAQPKPLSSSLGKPTQICPSTAGNNSSPSGGVTPPHKSDVSKCEDCNISFHRHDNYLIHKQHYCANRNGSVEQRAQTESPSASREEMGIHPDDSDLLDSNQTVLKTATAVSSSRSCFQFICVTCGIKFGSLNNLKAHQTYYCSRNRDPESQNVPATSPVCPTTVRNASTSSSTTTDPAAAEAPANLALSPIPAASPVQRRGSEADSVDTLTSSGSVVLQGSSSNNSVWKCPCCGVVCTSLLAAQKHIESHPNIRAFRCTLCGYRGNTLRGMRTHVRTLHFDRKAADMQEENYIACIFQNETNGPNDSASPTQDFSVRATSAMTTSSGSSAHPFASENLHPFNLMADFQRLLAANVGADHPDLATLAGTMPPEFALQMEALMRLQQQHQASNGEKLLIPPAFLNSLSKPPSTGVGCRSDKLFLCDLCCYSSSYRGNVLRHAKLVHSRDLIDVPVVSPAFLQAQKLLNLRNLDLLAQSDKVLTSPEPLHVKVDPEGLLSWPNHSVDKPAHSGNSTSSNGSIHIGHNSNPSSNGSVVSNNNNNTTKIELLSSPAAAANLNTSPVPPRLVTAPGAVVSPKLANGFPDVQDVAQKTCKSCNITFTYMSTFLAHKKYYCGSQCGSEGAELPKSPSETPVQ